MPADHPSAAAALSMNLAADRRHTESPESDASGSNSPTTPWSRPGRVTPSRRLSSRAGLYAPPTASASSPKQPLTTRVIRTLESISRQLWIVFLRLPRYQQVAVAIAAIAVPILSVLFLIYSHAIFTWLGPIAKAWRGLPGGWVIIWLMAFASAFPPLFGYSTAMTLSGMVYGFPWGWPLAASATVAGSTAAFMTSRGVFSGYVNSLVGKDKRFVALGQVLRRDGLLVLTGVRFCPLPYSLSNGFLSTIPSIQPVNFMLATAFVSPKLLIHVFIGSRLAILAEKGDTMSTGDKMINYAGMGAGALVGGIVGFVVYQRTMARAAELAREEQMAGGGEDGLARDEDGYEDGENARLMPPDEAAAALRDDDDISLWGPDDYEAGAEQEDEEGAVGNGKRR